MFEWTDERKEQLKTMWAEGLSGTQIAEQLGITRNSAIAKIHRLGKAGRAKGYKRGQDERKRKEQAARERPVKAPQFAPDKPQVTDLPPDQSPCAVTLRQLTSHTCRWPIDNSDGPMMYCGAEPSDGLSYCRRHNFIAYQQPQARKFTPDRFGNAERAA